MGSNTNTFTIYFFYIDRVLIIKWSVYHIEIFKRLAELWTLEYEPNGIYICITLNLKWGSLMIQKFILETIKIQKCEGICWTKAQFSARTTWTISFCQRTQMASSSTGISATINPVTRYSMRRKYNNNKLLVPFWVTSFTFQTYRINKLVHI